MKALKLNKNKKNVKTQSIKTLSFFIFFQCVQNMTKLVYTLNLFLYNYFVKKSKEKRNNLGKN
jgi:hypothetical protein